LLRHSRPPRSQIILKVARKRRMIRKDPREEETCSQGSCHDCTFPGPSGLSVCQTRPILFLVRRDCNPVMLRFTQQRAFTSAQRVAGSQTREKFKHFIQDFPPLQGVGIAVLHSARINREEREGNFAFEPQTIFRDPLRAVSAFAVKLSRVIFSEPPSDPDFGSTCAGSLGGAPTVWRLRYSFRQPFREHSL